MWSVLALISALGVSGCGGTVNLNEQQSAEAAEYIAGVLLKYSSNYNDSLIYNQVAETPVPVTSPEAEPTKEPEGSNGNGSQSNNQFAGILNVQGVELSCTSIKTATEYKVQGNDFVEVYAEKGKKLIVIKIRVKNITKKSQKVNLVNKVKYELHTAENKRYNAELTLLDGDINFFNERINPQKAKEALLVFQVPKKQKIDDAQLKIMNEKDSITLSLQEQ